MKLPRGTMTILSRIDPKSAESQVKKIIDLMISRVIITRDIANANII